MTGFSKNVVTLSRFAKVGLTKAVYANGRNNPNDEYFATNVSLRNLDIASLYIMNPKAVSVSPE